jgi:hypothetical protein
VNAGIWGITRKMNIVHCFRDGRVIHPTGPCGKRGWLFMPRPKWNTAAPDTCPICLRVLELEQIEESLSKLSELSTLS